MYLITAYSRRVRPSDGIACQRRPLHTVQHLLQKSISGVDSAGVHSIIGPPIQRVNRFNLIRAGSRMASIERLGDLPLDVDQVPAGEGPRAVSGRRKQAPSAAQNRSGVGRPRQNLLPQSEPVFCVYGPSSVHRAPADLHRTAGNLRERHRLELGTADGHYRQ